MKTRKIVWKTVSELRRGEHARHTGAYQLNGIVRPTRTSSIDRGVRFVNFGNHQFIPGKGEVIFGLNDIVEVVA